MSRFGSVRCYECGHVLDDHYEAFSYMRTIIQEQNPSKSHIDKQILETTDTASLGVAFQVLNIRKEKDCCRTHLLTLVLPRDLERK